MVATPPSGTPQPGQGADGVAPQQPARPDHSPEGNAPSQQGPQQSTRAGGDEASYATVVAERLGIDPAASSRKKRRSVAVRVVFGASGVIASIVLAFLLIRLNVPEEIDTQKEHDASQLPFTASARSDNSEPANWVMVLDRELTARETRTLTSDSDTSAAFTYLQRLGGRPLIYAPQLENVPPQYREQESDGIELADTVKMNLLSTRAYAVVIDDWEVVDVRCHRSTAKTVVSFPPQGGAAYTGIRLHIPPKANEPILVDEGEGQGEPYFSSHFIELGGGQSPAGLRIEAIAPQGQSCEWGVRVHYVDAHQTEQNLLLKDSKGNPLRIRTEAVPTNPRQKWVFGSVPWTPCHQKPAEPMCDLP